ncbi:D-sedoheptulose-7-phosphate isomerase [Rubrimonas cliftonensis]|uniref:D-sedoheptulose 7-phosphate isomerase n=1 Tax=Rubrimonas cliftonensis TaxID=89524 RepID=A0A1H4CXG2_9RHOB|nr:SIS domain-containing protein [Rubrimonas cliftonensis]SEA65145.1 D-sedoheptulose 7-phosphate isomerase [Rubrimonas cliftonensis]
MTSSAFLDEYFEQYRALLFDDAARRGVEAFAALALAVRDRGGKMMFAGNGASASTAEHGAVDFTKQGGVRGVTFHDPNLMTCFANDYGYDNWVARALDHYADPGDAVVLLSVSGASPSVVNAARRAREKALPVVAFTGRAADNPLRGLADVDFWAPSHAYNVVENLHAIWLTATIDLIVGRAVYETRATGA